MVEHLKSSRLAGIGEYYFSAKLREIDQLNKQGHDVLNLGIGSPDQLPPEKVKNALMQGFEESNYHQYQGYKGLPDLREAFANWYVRHFEVKLDPESEVLPMIGSKEGIMHISMSLLNEGDLALVPNPGYPAYAAATTLAGGEPVGYSLKESGQYHPDFDELEKGDLRKVKIMWVNYPHMPTGADGSPKLFEKLIEFSRKHQIVIVNDNPYGFILTNERRSILQERQPADLILELNSLSKSHNMAGWRVGVLAGQKDLIQTVLTFKSNMDSGQFKPVMRAAIAALEVPDAWYDSLNQVYKKRRKLVFEIAQMIGCSCNENQVGMFVWAKIPGEFSEGKAFTDYLLKTYRIFIPPGSVFGSEGQAHVRFSLCSPEHVWKEVMNRIKKRK
ncbi:MAG: aminotransferase class I/II-fold pyridoxal phosphate-dependent enzyme [Ekhidna sp.]